jgi:hypothetical protein
VPCQPSPRDEINADSLKRSRAEQKKNNEDNQTIGSRGTPITARIMTELDVRHVSTSISTTPTTTNDLLNFQFFFEVMIHPPIFLDCIVDSFSNFIFKWKTKQDKDWLNMAK